MDSVYLETTVVGNVAGRIHPNPDVVSRQHKTRRWWATAKSDYRLYISELLLDECRAGDPTAAGERIDEIAGLPRLEITDDVRGLAHALMTGTAIPRSWCRVLGDVELQTHRECYAADKDQRCDPRQRIRTTDHLHT